MFFISRISSKHPTPPFLLQAVALAYLWGADRLRRWAGASEHYSEALEEFDIDVAALSTGCFLAALMAALFRQWGFGYPWTVLLAWLILASVTRRMARGPARQCATLVCVYMECVYVASVAPCTAMRRVRHG